MNQHHTTDSIFYYDDIFWALSIFSPNHGFIAQSRPLWEIERQRTKRKIIIWEKREQKENSFPYRHISRIKRKKFYKEEINPIDVVFVIPLHPPSPRFLGVYI